MAVLVIIFDRQTLRVIDTPVTAEPTKYVGDFKGEKFLVELRGVSISPARRPHRLCYL